MGHYTLGCSDGGTYAISQHRQAPLSLETPGRAEYRGPGLQEAFNEQG